MVLDVSRFRTFAERAPAFVKGLDRRLLPSLVAGLVALALLACGRVAALVPVDGGAMGIDAASASSRDAFAEAAFPEDASAEADVPEDAGADANSDASASFDAGDSGSDDASTSEDCPYFSTRSRGCPQPGCTVRVTDSTTSTNPRIFCTQGCAPHGTGALACPKPYTCNAFGSGDGDCVLFCATNEDCTSHGFSSCAQTGRGPYCIP